MSVEKDRTRSNIKNLNKKKIIHAKVVLALISLLCFIQIINYITMINDTFIPKKYIFIPFISSAIISLPGIFCFHFSRFAFISGGIIAALIITLSLFNGNFFFSFIWFYVIAAQILGYLALNKEEKLNPKTIEYPDILDH